MICWSKHRQAQVQRTNSRQLINKYSVSWWNVTFLFFWLTWRPNRSDRGAAAVTCDLEEILPSAKIIRSVNQVCRDHPTGEDYPVISAQPIIEFCEKHGIKIASYGGVTPLLVFQMVYWRTFCPLFELDSNRRAVLPLLKVRFYSKWILQKGAIMITGVICISG